MWGEMTRTGDKRMGLFDPVGRSTSTVYQDNKESDVESGRTQSPQSPPVSPNQFLNLNKIDVLFRKPKNFK